MADDVLRSSELAAASSPGDVHAEAKLLHERLRTGKLDSKKLELAAYCGHEAALLVVGVCVACGSLPLRAGDPELTCVACGKTGPRGASFHAFIAGLINYWNIHKDQAAWDAGRQALEQLDPSLIDFDVHPLLIIGIASASISEVSVLESLKPALARWALSGDRHG